MSDFSNRHWVIFSTAETGSLDLTGTIQSPNAWRTNASGSYTFIKYEGDMPETVAALSRVSSSGGLLAADPTGSWTHDEILAVLGTLEWDPFCGNVAEWSPESGSEE